MTLVDINIITALIERGGKFGKWIAKVLKRRPEDLEPYYFEEYNKKVYVKANGDGMIVASLKLHVNDPIKTPPLIRTYDISDAKKETEFPDFSKMVETGNSAPFEEFGIWYSSQGDIVTAIEEEYAEEDLSQRGNKKFLSFKLVLNGAALEKGRVYDIIYALSIPGLYPIENGRFCGSVQEHEKYGKFRTSVSTYQTHKHLTYSVYTENGIVFSRKPQAFCKGANTKGNARPNPCKYRNNMFYEKFNFTLDNPQEYDIIYMEWDVKNPKLQI